MFPSWSDIRNDEQSLGYQLLNTAGLQLDHLREQLRKAVDNLYLGTSVVSDIDVYYAVQLPGSYEFTKADGDDTELLFTPPTVSGVVASTTYQVSLAGHNTVEDFWYNATPTRLSIETTVSGMSHLVASGHAYLSPLTPVVTSGIVHSANQLTVFASGITTAFGISDDNVVRRGIIQIEGTTRTGQDVTEELAFIHDGTQRTRHEFQSVDKVRVYGLQDPVRAFVSVKSAAFNEPDYPVMYSELLKTTARQQMPAFWGVGIGVSGQHTLAFKTYNAEDIELRLDGFVEKQNLFEMDLMDTSERYIPVKDLAVEPYSNRVWVVDSGSIYVYNAALPYPATSGMLLKQYDAPVVIIPSTYYLRLGDSVELDYHWRRPTQSLVKHRVWVQKPDQTKKSIENGVEVTYHTDATSWVFGEPETNRAVRNSDIFTPDQYGDWIYAIEAHYGDGSSSIDQRIISVLKLEPLAQFGAAALGVTRELLGIDFDSEHKLWIMDNINVKYQLNRHYDVMIVDFAKKIVYLRENYDSVRVT